MSHELDHTCPHCGVRHDAAEAALQQQDERPVDGDAMFCIDCGEVGVFCEEGNSVRFPTFAEAVRLDDNPDLARLRAAWLEMKRGGQ